MLRLFYLHLEGVVMIRSPVSSSYFVIEADQPGLFNKGAKGTGRTVRQGTELLPGTSATR